jgi:hypothetical protein
VEEEPGKWANAREIFMTISIKTKINVNNTINRETGVSRRYLIMTYDRIEFSMFKILKSGEEQVLEQLLA